MIIMNLSLIKQGFNRGLNLLGGAKPANPDLNSVFLVGFNMTWVISSLRIRIDMLVISLKFFKKKP